MILQEEYLKLTLSLSIDKDPWFIYKPGYKRVSLGEGSNNILYKIYPEQKGQIKVLVVEINGDYCGKSLVLDLSKKVISLVRDKSDKVTPLAKEVTIDWGSNLSIKWTLVENPGIKEHIVNRKRYKKNLHITFEEVDTSVYCYRMNCPDCGEIRYCTPSAIKLVNKCKACALDITRKKKALYISNKRNKND